MSLKNTGFVITGKCEVSNANRAIIIVGLPRGGTSAVAQAVHTLGVFSGNKIDPVNFEDLEMAVAYRAKDKKRLNELIKEREEQSVFAWKLPDIHNDLKKIHRLFSNPRYIFVYRDILALANRASQVHDRKLTDTLAASLNGYQSMVKFIRRYDPFVLNVSYEKMLIDPAGFVNAVVSFIDISVDEEVFEGAVSVITPSPEAYIEWSHRHQFSKRLEKLNIRAWVDMFDASKVSGWVVDRSSQAEIEVHLDDQLIAKVVSNASRPDLVEAGISATGNVGFCFLFSDVQEKIEGMKTVSLIYKGNHLPGSPKLLDF